MLRVARPNRVHRVNENAAEIYGCEPFVFSELEDSRGVSRCFAFFNGSPVIRQSRVTSSGPSREICQNFRRTDGKCTGSKYNEIPKFHADEDYV